MNIIMFYNRKYMRMFILLFCNFKMSVRLKMKGLVFFMEKNQKINCTVGSCKYNNTDKEECILKQIIVTPMQDCHTKKADESMCSSYEFQK